MLNMKDANYSFFWTSTKDWLVPSFPSALLSALLYLDMMVDVRCQTISSSQIIA